MHLQQEIRSDIPPGWHTDRSQITAVRTRDLTRGLLVAGRDGPGPTSLLEQCALRLAPVLLGLDRLLYEARLDPVSGLFDRLFLNEAIAREYALALRHAAPLGLLLLDVDNLKHLNDRHGHPAGDQALHQVGVALREVLRAGDLACRYGGDEFAVLLPHTDLAGARSAAHRVVESVGQGRLHVGDHRIGLTVSVGVAAFDPAAASEPTTSLLAQADASLYRAKAERDARVGRGGEART
jgi:diguanylate cyclase (GGDEF)-like protein